MTHSTTDTYKMKREIINFAKKFSSRLSAPDVKFTADMTYGIVASQSCLLTQIAQRLQENTKKIYTVDRLSDHLAKGTPDDALKEYLRFVRTMAPKEPVIHIDDSDVVKPEGYHFESLGIIGIAMAFLAHMTRKKAANTLLISVLEAARPIKEKVLFCYYRISDGIVELMRYARAGIRDWFKPKRTNQAQLRFRLPV